MSTPNLNKQELSSLVAQRIVGSPHGIQCYFIPIDDEWAIKVYDSMEERNDCFENQKKAEQYGLGPKTGKKINLPVGTKKFGYFTEIVETINRDTFNDFVEEGEVLKLQKELEEKTGLIFDDCWYPNVGIKDGRLICIDFGFMD